jgi:hypothetical protein
VDLSAGGRLPAEGEAAFTPRSRRPTQSPFATAPEVVDLILRLRKDLADQGLDVGPHILRTILAVGGFLLLACRVLVGVLLAAVARLPSGVP